MDPVFTLFDHVFPPYGRITLSGCEDAHPLPSIYSVSDGIELTERLVEQNRISPEGETQLQDQIMMSPGLLMFALPDAESRAVGEVHSKFRIAQWLKRQHLE